MISKTQIKNIKLLHSKKGREEQGLFIAEGPKVVNDLLDSPFNAVTVYAVKGAKVKGEVVEVTENELSSISALSTPNQVLGVFEIPELPLFKSLSDLQELVLALDDIHDPGNLGTIIRIADWFGIKYVLCSATCVEVYNPKVVQAAMGSLGRVQVRYADLDQLLKGFPAVFGAVLNGKNVYKEKLPDKGVLLIGNESSGIGEVLLKHVTVKLSIPGYSKGADSLNAAVATAILCSEFRRG